MIRANWYLNFVPILSDHRHLKRYLPTTTINWTRIVLHWFAPIPYLDTLDNKSTDCCIVYLRMTAIKHSMCLAKPSNCRQSHFENVAPGTPFIVVATLCTGMAELSDKDIQFIKDLRKAKEQNRISRRDALKGAGALGVGSLLGGLGASQVVGDAEAAPSTSDSKGDTGTPGNPGDFYGQMAVMAGPNDQIGTLDENGLDIPAVNTGDAVVTTGGELRVEEPNDSPDGSFIAVSSPASDPGITFAYGDGSGAIIEKFFVKINNGGFTIEDDNSNLALKLDKNSGEVIVTDSVGNSTTIS